MEPGSEVSVQAQQQQHIKEVQEDLDNLAVETITSGNQYVDSQTDALENEAKALDLLIAQIEMEDILDELDQGLW